MIKSKFLIAVLGLTITGTAFAGNEDRVGSAGASHLLVNPWARSSAMGDAGIASQTGLEASFMNIAGLSAMKGTTQMKFNYTNWMGAADISFNIKTIHHYLLYHHLVVVLLL